MILAGKGYAQFSPGELARVHRSLEGTQQCARCHDVGTEISGKKCLTCHTPIKNQLDAKKGFHFSISEKKCVSCHKDHLGIDARITIMDPLKIDHARTGFTLTGKHSSVQCEQCHTSKNIKDPVVLTSLSTTPRKTYLGLETKCVSCHEDRHQGKLGTNCQSCHTTTAWTTIPAFDHSKTKYSLTGKHESVACSKCHTAITTKANNHVVDLSTKTFTDCTPCHDSPHTAKFANEACSSCHTTQGWTGTVSTKFDHNKTAFKLIGRHAVVKCEQCHKPQSKKTPGQMLKLPFTKCTDCHADTHEGQFTKVYKNDCAKCHTEQGFAPSTYTLSQHNKVFALTGAHNATPCIQCHVKTNGADRQFHFTNATCTSCHEDFHKGEFKKVMGTQGCSFCHSTSTWKEVQFNHSKTKFPLEGKHASTSCEQCHHRTTTSGKTILQFKEIDMECESCHKDIHAKQFTVKGKTDCAACHRPKGWKTLLFDHNVKSVFKLTGAHSNVQCALCHRKEPLADSTIVRYKPVATACESCHKGMKQ